MAELLWADIVNLCTMPSPQVHFAFSVPTDVDTSIHVAHGDANSVCAGLTFGMGLLQVRQVFALA